MLELVPDGAWTWFNDARAIWHHGSLYLGYVKRSTGRSALAVYQPGAEIARELFEFDFGVIDRDDHNNPSVVALGDGRLLTGAASHNRTNHFVLYRSLNAHPLETGDWELLGMVEVPEPISYQNLFCLSGEGGRVYNFTRSVGWNPTLLWSDDHGSTWSDPVRIIKASGRRRPYVKFASNGVDRIDVLYTDGHPHSVPNSIYHFYIKEGRLWTSDGAPLGNGLAIDTDAGENGTLIYRCGQEASQEPRLAPAEGQGWIWDMTYDAEGQPVVLFQVQSSEGGLWNECRIDYCLARWSPGEGWQRNWIGRGGRPLYERERHYGGGITFDPSDPTVIFLSSNAADPFSLDLDNRALTPGEQYHLYEGKWTAGGIQWSQVPSDSTHDYLRPYIPNGREGGRMVLALHGVYHTYTDFQTGIVGLACSPPSGDRPSTTR